jgi:formate hydrogenlyase subunit 6/NADH:ubiquinone oxidoreductase subunit I
MSAPTDSAPAAVLEVAALDSLLDALRARGYRVVGPTLRDRVIVHGELDSAAALPAGWTDVQEPGSYRLECRDDDALFGYAVGPHSWKQELFPPRLRLWRASGDLAVEEEAPEPRPTAFVGVRACELAAIGIQDRVFTGGPYVDRDYAARRADVFLVAVECGDPASTCFCGPLGTGPGVEEGFDLALTELLDGDGGHRFLVRAGSAAGEELLAELPTREAGKADLGAAAAVVRGAAAEMDGRFEPEGVHDLLLSRLEHPEWDDVASRCLGCANCTMVCPTCFCTTVEDTAELDGSGAERTRVWDSCFSVVYAEMHGGNTRPTLRARYRQWLTHKLATWHDQFGTSGCVGCGRCIAWCPVGIDIRAEVAALRGEEEPHAHAR